MLHSHLPWLLKHGTWPVGEEWLFQAYARSYLPLLAAIKGLRGRGFTNIASIGITPVLAAQLDDPYALDNLEIWIRNWQLRALDIPRSHPAREDTLDTAHQALTNFEDSFSRGASPVIRSLVDAQAIEILGGPLAHPFTPNLLPDVHRLLLAQGLTDARRRWGFQPDGIWVPECAYRPGQESIYAELGVEYFVVDEPAVRSAGGRPSRSYRLGTSPVSVIARDIHISDHIWSAERGFPGRSEYRDFHDVNIELGLQLSRVGDRSESTKDAYIPADAMRAVERDAHEFIASLSQEFDRQVVESPLTDPLIVIAIDTELLGHWWYEGVRWFTRVIELLPDSGIQSTTLKQVTNNSQVTNSLLKPIELGESSWGAGKDWRLWTGDPVRDLSIMNHQAQNAVLQAIERGGLHPQRESELLNELSNLLSSDWAFMISRDSAAEYSRSRASEHFRRIQSIIHNSPTTVSSSDSSQPFYLRAERTTQL